MSSYTIAVIIVSVVIVNLISISSAGRGIEYAVKLSDPTNLEGFEIMYQVGYLPNTFVVRPTSNMLTTSQNDVNIMLQHLQSNENVLWVEQQVPRKQHKRNISPTFTDPLFVDQWHLVNTGQQNGTNGSDIHIAGAWAMGFSGRGVRIAIVDDGFQYTHPDLADAYRKDSSHNFNSGKPDDPSPDTYWDYHGTSCAGVAMARNNSVCGVGAAFGAEGAGIRLISDYVTDAEEAVALSYKYQLNHISSNSWGPADNGLTLGKRGTLTAYAMLDSVNKGRGGLGTIYVWAAGNGLLNNDNCNYDDYANARETIAVGAIDNHGKQSYYSEPCAAMLVCAPSSSTDIGITTSDLLGDDGYDSTDCTNTFGGTSSATPLVAGVIALMLEANPKLTWRDVQEILLTTADKNDFEDSDWKRNGADHFINHKYGFGRVNAMAAVQASLKHKTLGPVAQWDGPLLEVNEPIDDLTIANPITKSITVKESFKVEYVEVIVNISHTAASDLNIILESPSGTESILAELHGITYQSGLINVTSGPYQEQIYSVYAQFGPKTPVRGKVAVAVVDTFCEAPVNSESSLCAGLHDNIALIMRGVCAFQLKATHAQICGSIGVIIVNNIDEPPFLMPGTPNSVSIPSVMVSQLEGTILKNLIENGTEISVIIENLAVKIPVDTYEGWRFSTVRNWGEDSDGSWTIKVSDEYKGDVGHFHTWKLNIYGAGEHSSDTTPPTKETGVKTKWIVLGAILEAVIVAAVVGAVFYLIKRRQREGYDRIRGI